MNHTSSDTVTSYTGWHRDKLNSKAFQKELDTIEQTLAQVIRAKLYPHQVYTIYMLRDWINNSKSHLRLDAHVFYSDKPAFPPAPGTKRTYSDALCTDSVTGDVVDKEGWRSSKYAVNMLRGKRGCKNMPLSSTHDIEPVHTTDAMNALMSGDFDVFGEDDLELPAPPAPPQPASPVISDADDDAEKTHRKAEMRRMPEQRDLDGVRGGMLCQFMGMGKTLSSLCFAYIFGGFTIFAVPQATMGMWCDQVKQHFRDPRQFPIETYTESNAEVGIQTVLNFVRKHRGKPCGLVMSFHRFRNHASRVFGAPELRDNLPAGTKILFMMDEADCARNPNTTIAKRVTEFTCDAKILITATPLHNAINSEWASYARMLGIVNSEFTIGGTKDRCSAMLEAVQRYVTKRMLMLSLSDAGIMIPPCTYTYNYVEMSAGEKQVYVWIVNRLASLVTTAKRTWLKGGPLLGGSFFLRQLIRLRQAAVDTHILPLDVFFATDEDILSAAYTFYQKTCNTANEKHESHDEDDDDSIPNDEDTDSLSESGDKEAAPPTAKPWAPYRLSHLINGSIPKEVQKQFPPMPVSLPDESSKISRCATLCLKIGREKGKVVVFCEWRMLLDSLQKRLKRYKVSFVRIDGMSSATEKHAAISRFQNDPGITVFLATIRAGCYGISLTAANNVIVLQPAFNPEVERQGVARVNRTGQMRPVTVHRLLTNKTYELLVHRIASEKAEINDKSMGRETTDYSYHKENFVNETSREARQRLERELIQSSSGAGVASPVAEFDDSTAAEIEKSAQRTSHIERLLRMALGIVPAI